MKQLTPVQFFIAGLVLVVVVALVAVLADGLKKYDNETARSEAETKENLEAIPPSSPDAIGEELKKEEASASAALEAELAAETRALEEENMDVSEVTQSYE